MKQFIGTILVLVLTFFYCKTQAQPNACPCDKALSEDFAKEEYTSITQADYKKSLSIIFSKSFEYWNEEKWKDDKSMQSGGSYAKIYEGFLDANDTKESQKKQYTKDSINFKLNEDISYSTYKFISQKTASKTAYTAWLACIKTKCGTIGAIPEISKLNENEVIVTLHFYQIKDKYKEKIKLNYSSNLKPKPNNELRNGLTISGGGEYFGTFFIKDSTRESQIIIIVPGYDVERLFIPSIHSKKNKPEIPKIYIANGTITQNADIKANWGDRPTDENFAHHHSPHTVPYDLMANGQPEGPYTQGASSTTRCIATVDYDNDSHYKWTLNLTNTFHANSGPLGQGGSSYAAPYYKTTITLPQLLASQSSWNLNIDGSSWATNTQDPDIVDKEVRLDFKSNGINRSFLFRTKSQFKPENFKIDSLAPGEYTLTLQVSKIGLEAKFQQPNDDKIANVQTQLSVEISANKALPPTPIEPPLPPDYSLFYWIAGIILLGFIVFLIYKKRKSKYS